MRKAPRPHLTNSYTGPQDNKPKVHHPGNHKVHHRANHKARHQVRDHRLVRDPHQLNLLENRR
jgi:hypothetical protein